MPNKKFTRILYKMSSGTTFYTDDPSFTEYMNTKYVQTGKCIHWRKIIDSSDYHVTFESLWLDSESFNEAFIDPELITNNMNFELYNYKNSIYVVETNLEICD